MVGIIGGRCEWWEYLFVGNGYFIYFLYYLMFEVVVRLCGEFWVLGDLCVNFVVCFCCLFGLKFRFCFKWRDWGEF